MSELKQKIVREILGFHGRMISGSKGQYNSDNPTNVTVFNGNIVNVKGEKLWYGDLDLTLDEGKVIKVARELGEKVFVLREMDARFDNENAPKLEKAVYSTDGETGNYDTELYHRVNGRLQDIPTPEPTEAELEAQAEKTRNSYKQEEFEQVNLKLDYDDLEVGDEDYEDYNYLEVTKFFNNLTEDNSPLHNYQNHFIKEQGFSTDKVLRVYLTKETAEALKKQVEYWYRVFHGQISSEYRINKDVNFFWFNNGPGEFLETPEWAVEGKVYYRKDRE